MSATFHCAFSYKNRIAMTEIDSGEDFQAFPTQPKYNLKEDDVSVAYLDCQPSALASFVLPAHRFFHLLGICPSSYKFCVETQKFEHVKGSWFRKAISILLAISTALQTYGLSKLFEKQIKNTTILAMQKILGVCYFFFILSFYRAFLWKAELFHEIFNALQYSHNITRKMGCKSPPTWKIRVAFLSLLLCCVTIALLYTVTVLAAGPSGSNLSLIEYFEHVLNVQMQIFRSVIGYNGNSTIDTNFGIEDPTVTVLVGLISFLVHLWGCFCWGGAILMNTMWGLMFWLLLHQFYEIVTTNSTRNTLMDIRSFNAISGIIDKYNEAFGWVILGSIVTGTTHFSVNIFRLFNENVDLFERMLALVSFLWFFLSLIACAQVHKAASDIVRVIKSRFQVEAVWGKYHRNCSETAQGMMLVLHEIQTNSIGFKGLGFFTCTYSFIGTVMSAIATYAIIVIQFQT